MNKMLLFNEFVKKAQSNRDYYIWGNPSSVGMIEDVLAAFGLDYALTSHNQSMHENNLQILKDYILNHATIEQLGIIMDFIDIDKPLPAIDKREESSDSVFVSMVMNLEKYTDVEAIRTSISKAIKLTGNIPYFIDKTSHNENIFETMLKEIRACKFLVADFTHQNTGVYFEAGYARALGKTVIHTCKEADFNNVHFDIKQTQFVIWKNPEDLVTKLKNQIEGSNLKVDKNYNHS